MKPGIKTTEFWITLVLTVLGSLLASGAFGEGDVARVVGAVLASFSALGYGVSRGLAKSKE